MKKEDNFKNFNHLEAEKKIYKDWEKKNLFSSKIKKNKKKFSIIMPPPNVSGNLHIGHALNMTIQDVLCRYWVTLELIGLRMIGVDILPVYLYIR